jgi:hypothetical protein
MLKVDGARSDASICTVVVQYPTHRSGGMLQAGEHGTYPGPLLAPSTTNTQHLPAQSMPAS